MIQLFELATRSFWHFIGVFGILYLLLHYPTNLILQIIHKTIRAGTIRKVGYPPPHCDADGDPYTEEEDD